MPENNSVLTIPEAGRIELLEKPYPNVASGYVLVGGIGFIGFGALWGE